MANRLSEIHNASSPSVWMYIPGDLNLIAADGSRGMKIKAFLPTCRWWKGQSFLWQPNECWPNKHVDDVPNNDTELLTEKCVMIISPSTSLVHSYANVLYGYVYKTNGMVILFYPIPEESSYFLRISTNDHLNRDASFILEISPHY